jgi:hypothetical protein
VGDVLLAGEAVAILRDAFSDKTRPQDALRVAVGEADRDGQMVYLATGPYRLWYKRPDVWNYPNFAPFARMADEAIEKDLRVDAKVQDVLEALDLATIFMDGKVPRVTVAWEEDKGFRLQAGKGNAACPATALGAPTTPVGLNPTYLRKALKAMCFGPRVRIAWSNALTPWYFARRIPSW